MDFWTRTSLVCEDCNLGINYHCSAFDVEDDYNMPIN